MGAIKVGALENYSQRMGRLVERHLAEAALIAARQEAEHEAARATQARIEIELTAAALREEMSERERVQSRLAYLASHDALTGLPNRGWFAETLAEAVSLAGREGRKLAVLYLDLDNFKDVNDTLGHEVGDALLRQVADRLQATLSSGQYAARIGGDEFAIIITDGATNAGASTLAARLIAAICKPFEIGRRPIFVGASIGVSQLPADADTADLLQRHADLALYRAKADGRNRYQLFDRSLNDELQRRAMLEQAMREPNLFEQLRVVYQPQFDLRSTRISGAEALLRWHHPKHGQIWPNEFIPIAERTGLILPIGDWVLRESCRQAARWRLEGLPPLTVSVNVSALQFRVGNMPNLVLEALAETGLTGDALELEITETALMTHATNPATDMVVLSGMGVGLAIDDFGTGYSSLSYLRQIPVNRIKIDQSFIKDAPASEDASAVAATIVQLAHSLRLEVVAEGVETRAQLDFVRETGCRFAQGFYFSKPLNPADLIKLVSELTALETKK
jgi:diguanylate cyclase (GGDEF)-like protein